MDNINQYFPATYEASRQRFRDYLPVIKKRWKNAKIEQYRMPGDEDLTIDWISADAVKKTEKLLIFTTAEHGVEGYVGSAVLQLFFEDYVDKLDAENTGLLIVHTINPWGMKYTRRTNANNVDINRTFLWQGDSLDPNFNLDYFTIADFLMPKGPITNLLADKLGFLVGLAFNWMRLGKRRFNAAPLLGQYRFNKGIYFGGVEPQAESQLLMKLYREAFEECEHILHLDMHTGWGPRDRMTLIDSPYEPRSSEQVQRDYNYPAVAAANPEEFYALKGDMIDWVYMLRDNEFPNTRLYSTSFEFGTYGDSLWQSIRGLRTMIFENRLYWYGAGNADIEKQVRYDLRELFDPEALDWKQKAMADSDEALRGILKGEGFIE